MTGLSLLGLPDDPCRTTTLLTGPKLHGNQRNATVPNPQPGNTKPNYYGAKRYATATNGMGLAGLEVKRSEVQILSARPMSIRDISLTTIDGNTTSLAEYSDETVLIVNVASRCGLSPQYEKLERLQRTYGDRGFSVLGFPSNQFLQELSSETAIKEYCSATWGVTFPMFERVKVNGRSRHPLYEELTKTPDAAGKAGRVQWNFEKFLLSPTDEIIRFRPPTEPDSPEIVDAIEAFLPQPAGGART